MQGDKYQEGLTLSKRVRKELRVPLRESARQMNEEGLVAEISDHPEPIREDWLAGPEY